MTAEKSNQSCSGEQEFFSEEETREDLFFLNFTLRAEYSFYGTVLNCWPQIKALSFASVDADQITNWV